MSSTNRSRRDRTRSERRKNDFYPTPAWAIAPIVDHLCEYSTASSTVIDPFAGDGAILQAVAGWLGSPKGFDIDESRVEQCAASKIPCEVGDSLKDIRCYLEEARFIVTNPPYKGVTKWIYRLLEARAQMAERPIVALLLPIPFFESKARQQLHLEHPSHAIILSERISFTGDGKSDSVGSAWFVWGDGHEGKWSIAKACKPSRLKAEKKPKRTKCTKRHFASQKSSQ